jgi:short-subunit dehydrogenase
VVTGAAAGIGRAFALELLARGVQVLAIDRDAEGLARLPGAEPLVLDLTRADVADVVAAALGDRDVGLLVNNAGAAVTGPLIEHRPEAEADVLHLNARAPLLLTRLLAPALVARGRGGLIFVASTIAFNGGPGLANYAATKAWNVSFADSLAVELGPAGIDVLCVAPGMTATESLARSMDISRLRVRPLRPEAVAAAALDGLGRRTLVIPGAVNQASTLLSRRLLPRRLRHALMQAARPLRPEDG